MGRGQRPGYVSLAAFLQLAPHPVPVLCCVSLYQQFNCWWRFNCAVPEQDVQPLAGKRPREGRRTSLLLLLPAFSSC
jgi:hypothetical protein